MRTIPPHKAEIIRSATKALNQAARSLTNSIKAINDVHEFYGSHELQTYFPTKLVDPVTGRTVVESEEGLVYEDLGTPFEGDTEEVVDMDAVMPYGDQGLTVGDYMEKANFIATAAFYMLGNCYVAPDGSRVEELTAFGQPPLSHAEMHLIRRKNNF